MSPGLSKAADPEQGQGGKRVNPAWLSMLVLNRYSVTKHSTLRKLSSKDTHGEPQPGSCCQKVVGKPVPFQRSTISLLPRGQNVLGGFRNMYPGT